MHGTLTTPLPGSWLRHPAGLLGATRLLDLLFEGRSDFVVEAVRTAATT